MRHVLTAMMVVLLGSAAPASAELPLELIRLPPGFQIEIFAEGLPHARSLALGDHGTVFVGTLRDSRVYAITPDGQGGRRVSTVVDNMVSPNGVAFKDGDLYVAEVSRVWKLPDIERHLDDPPKPVLVRGDFSTDTWHGWKYIGFGPDGKLYIPVGGPCNVCEKADQRYASLMRMNPDGSDLQLFARGIRNTVGFDWDPRTDELWFTDNGRDNLGDNLPPDELNHAPRPGLHFGFPYCHGGTIPDPEFGRKAPCAQFVPPARPLGPHVASLGMRFYNGPMFPSEYQGQILIAEHGSWNRSEKIGYRIAMVRVKDNQAVSYEPFAEGWLVQGKVWGRPVDLLVMEDGSLLVSDDYSGTVYRIFYVPPVDDKTLEKADAT